MYVYPHSFSSAESSSREQCGGQESITSSLSPPVCRPRYCCSGYNKSAAGERRAPRGGGGGNDILERERRREE